MHLHAITSQDPTFSLVIDSAEFGRYESSQVTFPTVEAAAESVVRWNADTSDRESLSLGYVPRNAAAVDATDLAFWAVGA